MNRPLCLPLSRYVPFMLRDTRADTDSAPMLTTAIQLELGLKLEASKIPVQVLVIDHVEQPTAN